MGPFTREQKYSRLSTNNSDTDFELGKVGVKEGRENHCGDPSSWRRRTSYLMAVAFFLCLAIGFWSGVLIHSKGFLSFIATTVPRITATSSAHTHHPSSTTRCQDPPIRREWRSLSLVQKHEYVDAVLCLRTIPSSLNPNMSLYDDFPFLHDTIGAYGIFRASLFFLILANSF